MFLNIFRLLSLACVGVFRLLADADGIEVLAQLLTDSMAECRQFAAESIASMATDGKPHTFNQPLKPGTPLILPHSPPFHSHVQSPIAVTLRQLEQLTV